MANEELWDKLVGLDRETVASRAACQYLAEEQVYVVRMLNTDYGVDINARNVSKGDAAEQKDVEFLEELCLLAYLTGAVDRPLTGKLVRPQDLSTGAFFFRGQHAAPTEELKEVFGLNPQKLLAAGEQLGARTSTYGDVSIEIPVLPRIPVTVVVWAGDEEFEARASILLDSTAGDHLLLDALGALLNLTVKRLTDAAQEAD